MLSETLHPSDPAITRVEQAILAIQRGQMVILVDDEDRENEGDLVMAAEKVTPDAINFMARFGRGLICLSMTQERCDLLDLPPMVTHNRSPYQTAFTVSIEAARGVTTGISAADRAHTIQVAVAPETKAFDLVRPGHIFPLRAKAGGVLVRAGQTEGSVDLARLAGLTPAGVICEVMSEDGTMARRPELLRFAETHGLLLLSVADLIRYRLARERLVRRVAETELSLPGLGAFKAICYRTQVDDLEHLALVRGNPSPERPVLGRVHQASTLGDVFGALGDPRDRLRASLAQIAAEGLGVLVYVDRPGRKISQDFVALGALAPAAPTHERTVFPEELREYGIGAQILLDLGVRRLRLLSARHPGEGLIPASARFKGIQGYGLEVVEHLSIPTSEEETV